MRDRIRSKENTIHFKHIVKYLRTSLLNHVLKRIRYMITAIINQKGGVGKSSTAVHLACWLKAQGKSVVLIDSDTQTSSSMWVKSLDVPAIVQSDPNELAENIPDMVKGYDHAVIDGAGGLSEATRVILYYANIALIPCQPTALDLVSSGSVVKLVK